MASNEALQGLLDELRRVVDQARLTQGSLQQLRSAKKESDLEKRRHDTHISLRSMQDIMTQVQQEIDKIQSQLDTTEKQTGGGHPVEEKQAENKAPGNAIGLIESRNLLPAQQEALYELKASRMGAMRSQNQALKRELQLNQKKQHLLEARYAKTQSYSGSETLRAAHALEAKLRGASLKIKGLEEELKKSQQTVLYYREKYESSQHGSDSNHASGDRQGQQTRSTPKLKPAPLKEQSFIGPNTSVNDVVRKNECLLEENEAQRQEIQRLKRQTAKLTLFAKSAAADRNNVYSRLGTSEMAREDLQKRYFKLKKENSQLSRSYTRQAATWIEMKKQQQQTETQARWGEIYPVAPHGSRDRFLEHHQKDSTTLPRQMFPVESYGGTSTA